MAEKKIYTYPNGSTLVYYQQNINKCTELNVGFRIPHVDIPREDETICKYKNIIFYMDQSGLVRLPINKPGVAHFVEHMFFSSLPNVPAKDISSFFKRTNTLANASTSQDYVKTELNFPSKFAEQIFALNSKMIFRENYNAEDLKNEKKTIFQELQYINDMPTDAIYDYLTNNMETLLADEILGIDQRIIDSFSERQLINFGKTYFTKENLIMTVVSDLPFEQIKELCSKHFVEKAPSIPQTKITTEKRRYELSKDTLLLFPNTQQNTATITFALKGSTDYEADALFGNVEDFVLNDLSGRLAKEMRDTKGMVYTPVHQTISMPQQPIKIFSVQTTPNNVSHCINALTNILNDILTNGITQEEYEGFKEMWLNRRERKTSIKHNSADAMFEKIVYDEPVFVGKFFEKTQNLTKKQIDQYFKNIYSTSKLCMCVSGNFDTKDLQPIHEVLAKYRPYDKYLSENYIEHKSTNKLAKYVEYLAQHPEVESQIEFISASSNELADQLNEQINQIEDLLSQQADAEQADTIEQENIAEQADITEQENTTEQAMFVSEQPEYIANLAGKIESQPAEQITITFEEQPENAVDPRQLVMQFEEEMTM